jgi:hypothetical protein
VEERHPFDFYWACETADAHGDSTEAATLAAVATVEMMARGVSFDPVATGSSSSCDLTNVDVTQSVLNLTPESISRPGTVVFAVLIAGTHNRKDTDTVVITTIPDSRTLEVALLLYDRNPAPGHTFRLQPVIASSQTDLSYEQVDFKWEDVSEYSDGETPLDFTHPLVRVSPQGSANLVLAPSVL